VFFLFCQLLRRNGKVLREFGQLFLPFKPVFVPFLRERLQAFFFSKRLLQTKFLFVFWHQERFLQREWLDQINLLKPLFGFSGTAPSRLFSLRYSHKTQSPLPLRGTAWGFLGLRLQVSAYILPHFAAKSNPTPHGTIQNREIIRQILPK
jgi:hypothetical protein